MKEFNIVVTEEWITGYNTLLDLLLKTEGIGGLQLFGIMKNINPVEKIEQPEQDSSQPDEH